MFLHSRADCGSFRRLAKQTYSVIKGGMIRLSTRQKIFLAKILYQIVHLQRMALGKGMQGRFRRQGIHWELDLREGIDLAIYCFGAFERNALRAYRKIIEPGFYIIDVGANVGAHTLPFASLCGDSGKVLAVEATAWAFDKLQRNLSLNPDLAERVTAKHAYLVSDPAVVHLPASLYSSWRVDGYRRNEALHQGHLGALKELNVTEAVCLDTLIEALAWPKCEFLKIDVDGNEYEVFLGARHLLEHYRPKVFLEVSPHVHDERNPSQFGALLQLFQDYGYQFYNFRHQRISMREEDLRRSIPQGGSINVFALVAAKV